MKTVELVPKNEEKEEDKTVREKIMDQMKELAQEDIKHKNMMIIATPQQAKELDSVYTTRDREIFCDAEVKHTTQPIPNPIVIPIGCIRDILITEVSANGF